MRRFFAFTAVSAAAMQLCFANPVDWSRAKDIASTFLGCEVEESSYTDPAFYVFNGVSDGWIIVSADDSAIPVLAYSLSGSFSAPRSNVSAWLGGYSSSISKAIEDGAVQSERLAKMWQTAGLRTKAEAEKLLSTPSWDQESPYNLLCPTVKEGRKSYTSLTGCVATAMSEVLRYHQWPEKGSGTIGGYSYMSDYNQNVQIPSYSIDSHTYDYSLMPYTYTASASTAQNNAVAQLMHDCGVMVEAMYNYGTGTGAYSENIAPALAEHMGYSKAARLVYRQAYTDAQWSRLVVDEIDANRPIIYSGVDSDNGGHQFVCDGYNTNGYIHINWGWSGDSNGYYALNLHISGSGGMTFSDDQSMIVGLEPDKTSSSTQAGATLIFEYYDSSHSGLSLASGSILSKSFTVNAGYLYNISFSLFGGNYTTISSYKGSVRVALVDWQGNLKEYVSAEKSLSLAGGELESVDNIACRISGDVDFSDRVVLMYETSDGNWEQVLGREGLDYNQNTGDYSYVRLHSSIPAVDAAYIVLPSSPMAGDRLFFELATGSSAISSLTWYYDGSKQSGPSVILTSGNHAVRAAVSFENGKSETIYANLTVK